MITRTEIDDAAARIAPYTRQTPVMALEPGALGIGTPLVLKLELLQVTGSFKPRGAFNRILSSEVPAAGVIAASGGNHGGAVAYAARQLGLRAEIFVPEVTSPVKVERLRRYGAQVTQGGANYVEALRASEARAAETGALVVHAFEQPEIVAGQGTVGREFAAQAPDLDTVLVAVGGGGLIAGIAAWYRGEVRVVGVEPERAPYPAAGHERGRAGDGRGGWPGGRFTGRQPGRHAGVCDRAETMSSAWCWCPTRRSPRRSAPSGKSFAWPRSRAAPPPCRRY